MNSIMVIHPYKHEGVWVFDDEQTGLVREPFVAGADVILDRITAHIPDAERGVTIVFAGIPFPGHQHAFDRAREESGGNIYRHRLSGDEGWLCPALFKYFATAPAELFVEVRPKAGAKS